MFRPGPGNSRRLSDKVGGRKFTNYLLLLKWSSGLCEWLWNNDKSKNELPARLRQWVGVQWIRSLQGTIIDIISCRLRIQVHCIPHMSMMCGMQWIRSLHLFQRNQGLEEGVPAWIRQLFHAIIRYLKISNPTSYRGMIEVFPRRLP